MSIYNWLRRFLLGYLPEFIGSSAHHQHREHHGFLTVNTQNDSMTIPLAFNPFECFAEFVDDDNPPSCAPVPTDTCSAEKGFWSITVFWSVANERKIRWTAKQRCT